ncbi:carbohydrate-binding protein [Roseivirga sp. BDSF3-8]|uniref:carbohydrate-binding protein n=1 Tax=Roseivirga sp. BDSF3-8 TaxID=3241598 RepID=UPI00353264A6
MKKLYPGGSTALGRTFAPLFLFIAFLILPFSDSEAQNWQLVWEDNFSGSISPDWVFETGTGSNGWGNNELQYYRRANASVENGNLVITARRENYGGRNYTSARMKTQGRKSWRYGRIEARIAMPSFTGVWPAFWMLGDNISSVGWPACGEIDIMEHVNTEQATHGTIHWQDNNGNYASYGGYTGASVTNYHTYAIEWNASSIRWFLDGVQYHEVNIENGVNGTSEFHNKFFIILNMAIGGNWPGFSVDNNAFPAKMYVDYVRVYQGGGSTGGGGTFAQLIEAENFALQSGQMQTEACSEGGQNVGWLANGGWLVYDVNLPYSGTYNVQYRVASPNNGGAIQLERAGGSTVYGQVSVPNTGGWQNWTTVSHTVNLSAGQQQLAIYIPTAGYNINWLRISSPGARIGEPADFTAQGLQELSAYPNPAHNELSIKGLAPGTEFVIFDMMGRKAQSGITGQGPVDVSGLQPGTYMLQEMTSGSSLRFIKK